MKFSIRDLLWLTALAALAVAWWVDRRALTGRIDDLEQTIHVNFPIHVPLAFQAAQDSSPR
jgi:hypothetical protein